MVQLAFFLLSSCALLTLPVKCQTQQQRKRFNEFKVMPGHTLKNNYKSPLPHTYIDASKLPSDFSWHKKFNGTCFLTHVLNQHLPQYCGSCWAHGALSSLADRVKISRKARGPDINLSIQYILNCGTETAGSCHGGSATGVYQFIFESGKGVPYDTCMPYIACSDESTEGFCSHVSTKCSDINICSTCNSFSGFPFKGKCTPIYDYPNCTIAEYGTLPQDADAIKADIVSIVGWKTDSRGRQFWIVRNSWGVYWGDLGFFYLELGKNLLGIEAEVSWATPGTCTERNFPCDEDGKNCDEAHHDHTFVDPSVDVMTVQRRILSEAAEET